MEAVTARRPWALLAVLVVLVGVGAAAVATLGDGQSDEGERAALADDTGVASAAERELLALADRGPASPHHAVYEQSGGERLEVWVDGEQAREDVTPTGGPRRRLLRTDGRTVRCVEAASGWACTASRAAPVGAGDRLRRLRADLAGAGVAVRGDELAGHDVRCFELTGPEGPMEMCLTPTGVVARLVVGAQRLELVALDGEVETSHFVLPARHSLR